MIESGAVEEGNLQGSTTISELRKAILLNEGCLVGAALEAPSLVPMPKF